MRSATFCSRNDANGNNGVIPADAASSATVQTSQRRSHRYYGRPVLKGARSANERAVSSESIPAEFRR